MPGRQRERDMHTPHHYGVVLVEIRAPCLHRWIGRSQDPEANRKGNRPSRAPRAPPGSRAAGTLERGRPPPPLASVLQPSPKRAGDQAGSGRWFPRETLRRPCGPTLGPRPRHGPRRGRRGAEGRLCAASKQETGSLTVASRSGSAPFPGLSSGLVRPLPAARLE